MGFFDRDVHGGFDAMFDFNRDGVLSLGEQLMQYDYLETEEEQMQAGLLDIEEESDSWDEDDEIEEIQDEIEFMDREEAIEYIEDMGYDVDDFDLD